ncbi:MAG: LEPR-XLL domain-containing protein [Tepidisphaerales bacterium]
MFSSLFDDLEPRVLLSATVAAAPSPAGAAPALAPVVTMAAAALPKFAARYLGSVSIPTIGHFKSTVLTITRQNANGSFTGTLIAAGSTVAVSGVMKANRTFTITAKGSHVGGVINGTGTGTLNAAGTKITISMKFVNGSRVYPGTITLVKG